MARRRRVSLGVPAELQGVSARLTRVDCGIKDAIGGARSRVPKDRAAMYSTKWLGVFVGVVSDFISWGGWGC